MIMYRGLRFYGYTQSKNIKLQTIFNNIYYNIDIFRMYFVYRKYNCSRCFFKYFYSSTILIKSLFGRRSNVAKIDTINIIMFFLQ